MWADDFKQGTVQSYSQTMMEERDFSKRRGSRMRKWSPTFQTIVFLSNPLRTCFFHGALDTQKTRKEILNKILSKCGKSNRLLLEFWVVFFLKFDGIDHFGQRLTGTVAVVLFQLGASVPG